MVKKISSHISLIHKYYIAFAAAVIFWLSALSLLSAPLASSAPPEGFQSTPVITSGLEGPSGFEVAPDGRIFILERTGAVKIYKDGQLLPESFLELPSIAAGDRGLIGIAFDPNYDLNCYVYFYYTNADDLLNYLVRYSACEDTATDGPVVIYKTTSPSQELHVGGSIRFGLDGKLYFAVGDNGYPPNGQDLGNPHGKILRINKDGTVPTDNPFYGQAGALDEIWAYGMRNPWRFQVDPLTGLIYGGDVGDFSWEEVNNIKKGENYGWPLKEGYCEPNCEGTVEPIYAYPHDGFSAAITGGPVYRETAFPEEYQGDLFFGDYAMGVIKHINLGPNGESLGVNDFDTNAGSVVDLKVADDGSMYYLTYYPGRLYRVTYNSGNSVPTANATSDITKGLDPLTVNFSSDGSSDPDGDPLTYLWDFGDETTSDEANPTKIFGEKGTYTVELTVSDGVNFAQAVPIVIQVGTPPTVRISTPVEGDTYKAGDEITYNAFAEDAAGNDLNDANISTDVFLHHGTHNHPFIDDMIGRANSFTIPDYGESSADTWYRIITTVTDDNGLTDTAVVNIYPEVVDLTFDTNVAGIGVSVDGVPYPNPYQTQGVINFKRELSAKPIKQGSDGNYYQFESWSDGGAIRHQILTPDSDTTYRANYAPAPSFEAEYFDNTTLAGEPVYTADEPIIDLDWGDGSPDAALPSDEWSARFTKDQFFAAGRYKFTTASDDGVRLYIDGELVIDEFVPQVGSHSVIIDLDEGMHDIRLEYMEAFGGAYVRLNWDSTPDQPQVLTPYSAEYFDNNSLSGTAILTRNEDEINHTWDGGSPDPSVPIDLFSARWQRTVELEEGAYEFTATADDGIRVYLDDELVIDQWKDQAATTYKESVNVEAGAHDIKVEYYENYGGAVAQFSYTKTGDIPPPPTNAYTAEYWNLETSAEFPPEFPGRDADATGIVEEINFNWGDGSPEQAINFDNFLARWTKTQDFEAGSYKFTTTSDDGVRVFLDGEKIMDHWVDQGSTTYTKNLNVSEGPHEIVVEYYEHGGGAVAGFAFEKIPVNTHIHPYSAEYWNTPEAGSKPAIPTREAELTRDDDFIDFDWGGGSPDAAIDTDHFITRWTNHNHDGGTYRFTTTSDDGIRVYANGALIIDAWNDQAATTETVDYQLPDDWDLVIEYYENTGGATAKFDYELIDPTPAPKITYSGEFWNLPASSAYPPTFPASAPDFTRDDAAIDFDWGSGSPDPSINTDGFLARWMSAQNFSAGTYRFSTTSDDGIRLFVDGELIIDEWNDQGSTLYSADIVLSEGEHTIVLEYYEHGGGAVAKLGYELLN